MIRLNIGAGDKHWPGWINCDAHGDADVVTDCRTLPLAADYADEIQSIHFVEHIPRMDVDNMLADWYRVLKRGGKLVLELPCLNKIAQHIVNGERNMIFMQLGIFGDPRDKRPGMTHQWAWTREELTEVVRQAGFKSVEIKDAQFHQKKRDMRLEAVKP